MIGMREWISWSISSDFQRVRHNKGYALSGGERRRVEIARSLVTNPSFLLLDEPFSGIDPIQVLELQRIIGELRRSGIGILNYRPQCAGNIGGDGSRLYHQQRKDFPGGNTGGPRRGSGRKARIPGRELQMGAARPDNSVSSSTGCDRLLLLKPKNFCCAKSRDTLDQLHRHRLGKWKANRPFVDFIWRKIFVELREDAIVGGIQRVMLLPPGEIDHGAAM